MKKRSTLFFAILFSFSNLLAQSIFKDTKIEFSRQSTIPTTIEFPLGSDVGEKDFIDLFKKNYSFSNEDEFILKSSEKDALGYLINKYQQYHAGILVEGAEIILSTQNNKMHSYIGNGFLKFPERGQSAITIDNALNSALKVINAKQYKWEIPQEEQLLKLEQSNLNATYFPIPSASMVYAVFKGDFDKADFRLCYKMDIYAAEPLGRYFVYVDVTTAEVVNIVSRIHVSNATGTATTRYNGTQNISTDSYNGSFRLRTGVSLSAGRKIETYNMNNGTNYNSATEFTDADNNWTADPTAYSCHFGAEKTYDYFFTAFNRNSFDNAGAAIKSYVHYDRNYVNAYWDGSRMTYGDGDGTNYGPLTSLDVCGHEITHAVTERTSNLVYQNESGALNESFSDIFGECIENFAKGSKDWLIGADFDLKNNKGFRNFKNPNAEGHPDTYKGTHWVPNAAFPNAIVNDNGGVHSNSGVQNFWFYLLTEGGSGTNDINNAYSVTGIGIAKAAAISYRTNTQKLVSSSKFADARTGSIAAAKELYGTGSQEEISVTNAWYAVGVGAAYSGPASGSCNTPAGLSASGITTSSANLSWAAVSGAVSYNLQYKLTSSGTFTTVNTTSTTYALSGLSANSSYDFQVQTVCSGSASSAYSATSSFTTLSGGSTTYCTSKGNSASSEWIKQVQIGSINNSTASNGGYANFTNLSTNLVQGSNNTITLTPGFSNGPLGPNSYPEYWRVFVDFNQDGDFTDAGELAFDAGSTSTTAKTGTLVVPSSANLGSTRMRVQMKYNAAPTSCETFAEGEVEDYTANIVASAPVVCNTPSGLSAGSITSSSATLSWGTVSGASTYNYKYKLTSSGTWTSGNTSSTSVAIASLSPSSNYEFQVQSACSGGNTSAFSASQTFSTNSVAINYCTSKGNSASSEWIKQVQIGSINNATGANAGYADFTSISTNLVQGSNNAITLTPGFSSGILGSNSYPEYWRVYIDFNQDGDFLDAGELAFDAGSTSTTAKSGTLVVPAGATLGSTRMRVQMKYNAAPTSCETFSEGEVEDYTANIVASAGFIGAQANVNNGYVFNQLAFNPNPSTGKISLTIQLSELAANASIKVIDLSGKIVFERSIGELQGGVSNVNIDLNHLSNGFYQLIFNSEKFNNTQKLIIAH